MSWSIVFCLQATKHRFFFVCLESCQFGSIDATTKLFMLEHAIVRIRVFASWISVVIQIFRTLGFFSVRTWSSAPVRDIFVAKLRETRFANSSLRSCTQFVSGHAGYLNELYMPEVLLSFSFHSAPHHKLFTTTFRGQMCDDILHQCPSQYIWWWLLPRPSDICFVLVRISSGVVGHGFSGLSVAFSIRSVHFRLIGPRTTVSGLCTFLFVGRISPADCVRVGTTRCFHSCATM